MIVKLTSEQVALVGATSATDFAEKFTAFCAEAKEIKSMAETTPDFSALEKRIADLEGGNLKLQEQVKTFTTEAQVKTIAAETTTATLSSEGGKKIIEAEASRVVVAAMGGTGTTPVKPSPAAGPDTNTSEHLIAQGKFEEAFAADKSIQAEFPDAKCYAAFMKNRSKVNIRTR